MSQYYNDLSRLLDRLNIKYQLDDSKPIEFNTENNEKSILNKFLNKLPRHDSMYLRIKNVTSMEEAYFELIETGTVNINNHVNRTPNQNRIQTNNIPNHSDYRSNNGVNRQGNVGSNNNYNNQQNFAYNNNTNTQQNYRNNNYNNQQNFRNNNNSQNSGMFNNNYSGVNRQANQGNNHNNNSRNSGNFNYNNNNRYNNYMNGHDNRSRNSGVFNGIIQETPSNQWRLT